MDSDRYQFGVRDMLLAVAALGVGITAGKAVGLSVRAGNWLAFISFACVCGLSWGAIAGFPFGRIRAGATIGAGIGFIAGVASIIWLRTIPPFE